MVWVCGGTRCFWDDRRQLGFEPQYWMNSWISRLNFPVEKSPLILPLIPPVEIHGTLSFRRRENSPLCKGRYRGIFHTFHGMFRLILYWTLLGVDSTVLAGQAALSRRCLVDDAIYNRGPATILYRLLTVRQVVESISPLEILRSLYHGPP